MAMINLIEQVKSIEISPDGRFLMTSSAKEKEILRVWDVGALMEDSVCL
jgi:hypothetical protein